MMTPPDVRNYNDTAPEIAFLDDWRRILETHERLILAKRFSIKYNACWRNGRRLLFTIDSSQDELPWDKIQSAQGAPIEIREISPPSSQTAEDGLQRSETLETTFGGCTVGTLTSVSASREQVEVLLDETAERLLENRHYQIPQPGLILYTAGGIPLSGEHLEQSIAALQRGESANPNLRHFLVEPGAASLPSPTNQLRLVRDDLLLPFLNGDQIKSVEAALNAPDFLLIQASPGNERSSTIAEICHQMGMRGKHTLLTSPSSLAVDAALSFLVQHPTLRPLRLAQPECVQANRSVYTEARQDAIQPRDDSNGRGQFSTEKQESLIAQRQDTEIQSWIVNLPEMAFNQLGEFIRLEQELEQTTQSLNRIDQEFLHNANTLASHQGIYMFMEKLLGNITQPVFSDSAWNFKKEEGNLETDLIRTHPALLELKQATETLSKQLIDWADITVIRYESDAPIPISSIFRQADQISKHHARISNQARELQKWLHKLEPEIQDYYTRKEQYIQITQQREQINQVIQECETVIEQSQTEIPHLKDFVQQYGSLYMKLKESRAPLAEWLQGVITQSLDPEFVPLPWILNSAKCDDVWPTVWNTYKLPDFQSLFEMHQRDSKNAVRCRILSRELNSLADQLSQFTSPEALEEIDQPKINWSVDWIKDLIEFDVRGDVLPRPDAESKLREMGQSFLDNLQDPEWRQEKFQDNEQKLQRQIAHRISQLKEISGLVENSMYRLEEDSIHIDERIQAQLNASVIELQATAMRITNQLGNQKYQELNNLQSQADRAIERLAEMQARIQSIEERHTEYMQLAYNFHDALEANFHEAASLFPALQIKNTLKGLEGTDPSVWKENWRRDLSAFDEKIQQLDTVAADLQPVETLLQIIKDLKTQIDSYEATKTQLSDDTQVLGSTLSQINAAFQESQRQHRSAGHDWQQWINRANLVGAPLSLVGSPHFSRLFRDFDCVLIDEANLATLPELLPAMLKGKTIVLVGDQRPNPLRIGSYLVSDLAEQLTLTETDRENIGKPLFQVLFENCPLELRQTLT